MRRGERSAARRRRPTGRGHPKPGHGGPLPGVTIHLLLVERVVEHWRGQPGNAPFSPTDPVGLNAFRQGAFGPDLGYLPGGYRPLSDLAHCLRAGDLARCLLSTARTPLERGFACGWAAHLLADVSIHPLIGHAVGELVHGDRSRFVDGDSDPAAHVRVESGLDAAYARHHAELRALPRGDVFDELSIGFLHAAYRAVYGPSGAVDRGTLLRSHRTAVRRAGQGLDLAAMVGKRLPRACGPPPSRRFLDTVGGLCGMLGRRSRAFAYLVPSPPSTWLLQAVEDIVRAFVPTFLKALEGRLAELGNPNLDTGRPEEENALHGGYVRACGFLGGTYPRGALHP